MTANPISSDLRGCSTGWLLSHGGRTTLGWWNKSVQYWPVAVAPVWHMLWQDINHEKNDKNMTSNW